MAKELHFDVVVIGSGFGGSVTALRLREKGYSVAVLEAGRRFEDKDILTVSGVPVYYLGNDDTQSIFSEKYEVLTSTTTKKWDDYIL